MQTKKQLQDLPLQLLHYKWAQLGSKLRSPTISQVPDIFPHFHRLSRH
jgi:hypothetical protein